MNKSIILLSGGLDSVVALSYCNKYTDYNITLALTFDYGQKAVINEINSSKKICEYYNIEHKIIQLDWLKDITNSSLVSGKKITENLLESKADANSVWVPNRNALFLNIAACYCDAFGYDYVIYGANKDEAKVFPDNTELFRKQITDLFENSTLKHPKVVAPLINYNKDDIVKIAVRDNVPLEYVYSCYNKGDKHCGKCESCRYLMNALIANGCKDYIRLLFDKDENEIY